MDIQPTLVLLCSQNTIDIAGQMKTWLADQADVHLDVESIGRSSSYSLIKSGVGVIVTIAPFEIDRNGLSPVFYKSNAVLPQSQIFLSLDSRVGSGLQVPAVVKQLLSLAAAFGAEAQAIAAIWTPAGVISGFEYFADTVLRIVGGGPFPALSLIGFATDSNGCISSQGLEQFAGQEVRLTADSLDQNAKMLRMVRLLHDLVVNGAIRFPITERGLIAGERVSIVPSVIDGHLDVSISSKMA